MTPGEDYRQNTSVGSCANGTPSRFMIHGPDRYAKAMSIHERLFGLFGHHIVMRDVVDVGIIPIKHRPLDAVA